MLESLQIVVLKCPYADWFSPSVQDMFTRVVTLKLAGYRNKHFFGIMPVDGTDLVTDHILICKREPDRSLTPILGSKTLPFDICPKFHQDFTIEKFFRSSQNFQHLEALQRILGECASQRRRISYYSSFTIAPSVRNDTLLVKLLKEIYAAATLLHHREQDIPDLLGLGLPKFGTEHFFQSWGFEPVSIPDPAKERLTLASFRGIDAVFMHLRNYSPYVEAMAQKYRELWEQRLNLGITVRELEMNPERKVA